MTTKHTPGPWKHVNTSSGMWIKSESEPGYFANITGYCKAAHGEQAEANARLIAAAPLGLEMARLALEKIDNVRWPAGHIMPTCLAEACELLETFITKATEEGK